MKQAYIYNHLVRTYYRTKNKLQKLFATGNNIRKQDILKRRLHKLFTRLSSLQYHVKKVTLAGALTAGIFFLQPGIAKGQTTFVQHPALNPFGLDSVIDVIYDGPAALVDIDDDGDLDLFLGSFGGSFTYSENLGTSAVPVFNTAVSNPFSLTEIITDRPTPVFADLDADDDMDMLAGDTEGDFVYFENTGSAASPFFAAPVTNPFSLSNIDALSKPLFGDLDADGDLDLLSGQLDGNFYYFQNTGSATSPAFAAAVTNPFTLAGTGGKSNPALTDLDADGDLDLLSDAYVISNATHAMLYFENTGTASMPEFTFIGTDTFNLQSGDYPVFADMDADGDMDIIATEQNNGSVYFQNYGTPESPDFQTLSMDQTGGLSHPAFADIDSDGDQDMLSGNWGGTFDFYENTGTAEIPHFNYIRDASPYYDLSAGFFDVHATAAFADLDNDGDFDLLSGNDYGDFYYFENIGTAGSPVMADENDHPFSLEEINEKNSPAFADLDNDGDFDIMAGDAYGNFYFYRNAGTSESPTYEEGILDPFSLSSLESYSAPVFADFDHDGDFDMMAGEKSGNFYYFENIESVEHPQYDDPQINPFNLSDIGYYATPAFADLDNDGDVDILSGSEDGYFFYFENTDYTTATYFRDADGDGFGDPEIFAVMINTPLPEGFSLDNTDCNDADAAINPAATEICNGVDDNCAGGIDDGLTFTDYYPDLDLDTYGDEDATAINACAPVEDAVTNNLDCDDTNAAVNPAATEVFNLIDDDCDGSVDEGTVAIQNINTENVFIIYPNPAHDQLTITCNFINKNNGSALIKISDATGRNVLETTGEMINGKIEKIIAVSKEFESGVYYVQMQSAEHVQVQQLVVIK